MSRVAKEEALWGPLAHPIANQELATGDAPWRDNAWLAFWDTAQNVSGGIHVSTSPNAPGRRARCSIAAGNRVEEVIEPLDSGTFRSTSIEYDLNGRILVSRPGLDVDLELRPRFFPAEFVPFNVVPAYAGESFLSHYEQGAEVTGTINIHGETYHLHGRGFRDRTWGFRDEQAGWTKQLSEYFGFVACFETFDLCASKYGYLDAGPCVVGYQVSDVSQREVAGVRLTRDAAGLFSKAVINFADGGESLITIVNRRAGFWVPQGEGREGPVLSAYDEIMDFEMNGERGTGCFEQGVVKRLY
ncbi:DUF7065 domain-containing protein [Mycobacterium avium]|uniref:DUF7065 domain-containing protein n=1 Tax=Mycobacterium avium TaxID=1764 RepID=UPI000AD63BD3|nr:hypothetical protein [Mycobacterium avium]